MRDFKAEIDRCDNPNDLREVLDLIEEEIDLMRDSPYESVAALRTTRDLELLLRYGEHKLEKLLT